MALDWRKSRVDAGQAEVGRAAACLAVSVTRQASLFRIVEFSSIAGDRSYLAWLTDLVDVLDPPCLACAYEQFWVEDCVERTLHAVRSDSVRAIAAGSLTTSNLVSWQAIGADAVSVLRDFSNKAGVAVSVAVHKFVCGTNFLASSVYVFLTIWAGTFAERSDPGLANGALDAVSIDDVLALFANSALSETETSSTLAFVAH